MTIDTYEYEGPKRPYFPHTILASRDDEGAFRPGEIDPERLFVIFQKRVSDAHFDRKANAIKSHGFADLTFLKTGAPSSSVNLGIPLQVTTMRKLIAWIQVYFMYMDEDEMRKTPHLKPIILRNTTEIKLLIGNIVGMKIVGEEDPREQCHSAVFGGEPWFNYDIQTTLLSGATEALQFLRSKYPSRESPKRGDIIVYFDDTVKHYGRIVSIHPDGSFKVVSKSATSFYFEHSVDAISYEYGDRYEIISDPSQPEGNS